MAGPFTLIPTEVLQDRNMQQITDFGLDQTTAAAVAAANTGWDDVQGPAMQGAVTAALTQEAFADTAFQALFMRHDQNDELSFALQMPHRWNRGEVRFHLHVCPMVNPALTQVVRFDGSYAWAKIGEVIPLNTGWTAFTPVSYSVLSTAVRKHEVVPLFTTTPTLPLESDILLVRVRRPGASDVLDTYETSKSGGTNQANLCILSFDAHFQVNKAGTATEIPVP